MRRCWYRELIDEMREENARRRAEHERWLVEFDEYREEWRARVDADQSESRERLDAAQREWRARLDADQREWRARLDADQSEWRARHDADQREWRARFAAQRADFAAMREDQRRRFDAIEAAMENDKRVTREILLELREGREMIRDMRHGIQANTEGLLRVLDDLRRNDGPSTASA
jgi:hypothetical protein